MKKYLPLFVITLVLASCSSPKYSYRFSYHDYSQGKKEAALPVAMEEPAVESILLIDEKTLVASANEDKIYVTNTTPTIAKEEFITNLKIVTKEERRELRREVKKIVKMKRSDSAYGNSAQSLSNDVKLSAIFGAVGIVLLIIGGSVLYVLGAVALLIGLYFFIRWLIHQ